ncbi:MAG: bleomycin resistance family protein [Coprobacillus sp.]|nr:bleomycin resistance family protein [Coprobacillus sp.]
MYETITTNIMVNNVKETIKFYVENLGFQKVLSVPEDGDILNFAILSKDKISIMFQEKENLIEEYPTLNIRDIVPTFTLFITVDNVKALYDELKEKVQIAKELHQTFYGQDEFAIFDNNGNILTISC